MHGSIDIVDEVIKMIASYVAYGAEGMAALIIAVGAVKAILTHMRMHIRRRSDAIQICSCRLQLGHSLSLALEFLIGADVLKTAIAPSWGEIGQLAAIIAIRTVLNFFLMWELERTEKEITS